MRFLTVLLLGFPCAAFAAERHQSFDADPQWDGHNNRPSSKPVAVKQDFGYSTTFHSSDDAMPGEIGGSISPAGEPAWYGKKIPALTFNDKFSASGTMVVPAGGGNTLIGFFNPATAKEWRTANSLVWRINGRGEIFHAHFEYMTQKWRAGAGVIGRHDAAADRVYPNENTSGSEIYDWSIEYDPAGNSGGGTIKASLGDLKSVSDLSPGHKDDGASFDHFGILNVIKSVDGPGEIWIGDLTINGEKQDLARDPNWEGSGNRRAYETDDVRPWFNFGWSATNFAGGAKTGEMGGRFFRGDCREAQRLGYYGDRLGALTLEKPLWASGKITLRRGVSDSTTLLGFFHHERSVAVNPSQSNAIPADFLGIAIEGPSSEGFYVYPLCRSGGDPTSIGFVRSAPRIYPDGAPHDWTLEYDPGASGGRGAIKISLDGQSYTMEFAEGLRAVGANFDRFGLVTPWIDGNAQVVYFDDLSYTATQE